VKKIAQNVAQHIFSKSINDSFHGEKTPKNFGYFCNLEKNLPESLCKSENSSNLVTLDTKSFRHQRDEKIDQKLTKKSLSPSLRKPNRLFGNHWLSPGADVMITIFCDFANFRRKKLVFF
jgi:hypothetical protein